MIGLKLTSAATVYIPHANLVIAVVHRYIYQAYILCTIFRRTVINTVFYFWLILPSFRFSFILNLYQMIEWTEATCGASRFSHKHNWRRGCCRAQNVDVHWKSSLILKEAKMLHLLILKACNYGYCISFIFHWSVCSRRNTKKTGIHHVVGIQVLSWCMLR